MKSKTSKKGIVLLTISVAVIALLFYQPSSNTSSFTTVEKGEQNAIDVFLNSVVDTNVILTDSDQSAVEQFLDEQGIGFTEKFGIQTNVALIDSNGITTNDSSIFGVNESPSSLSITDKDGNILDQGGIIQVTFESIAQGSPKSVTSWAVVSFYLDDNLIKEKRLWSGYTEQVKQTMSVLNSLSVVNNIPTVPSFSDRENQNFTFDFNDENLSDGTHTFRVVLTEINAVIDGKNFNFNGEKIPYSLDFIVDGNKITKDAESGNGVKVSVYKSDNRFIFNVSNTSFVAEGHGSGTINSITSNPYHIEVFVDDVVLVDIPLGSVVNNEILFARDSNVKILVDGKVVLEEHSPLSQKNYGIAMSSSSFYPYGGHYSWSSTCTGGVAQGTLIGADFQRNISSSFGWNPESIRYSVGEPSQSEPLC